MSEIDELTDHWDANSELSFEISVRIDAIPLKQMNVTEARLALTATCADTAYVSYADVPVDGEASELKGTAVLEVSGHDVSQMLELRAEVIGRDDSAPWLARRIIGVGPQARVPLDSELVGFPTSSYSFDNRGIPAAPWRLVVSADSLDAPFAHSIRLELNDDYTSIRRLINGKPDPATDAEINASITRVLIATVSRLWDAEAGSISLEAVAAEFPDSITAAAQRAAVQRAALSLSEAVSMCRLRPETLEYAIASQQRTLRS
ncbi:hypothetical protein [Agrococcus casei]|uniref:hypothetical protein n=1 Tax=Microbacteriaceae TaxID=85023 RepID=UPI003F928AAA